MKLSLTLQCLLALTLGILLGTAIGGLEPGTVEPWRQGADGLIRLWTNALRMVVTPLVVAQLFSVVVVPTGRKGEARKLGMLIPTVFVGLFLIIALVAVLTMKGLLSLSLLGDFGLGGETLQPASAGASAEGASGGSWIDELVPPNLFAAASSNSILGLMLFTTAFGLAARRLAPEPRGALSRGATAVRDALFVLIGWLLRLAPLVLFALGLRASVASGLGIGKVLLAYTTLAVVGLVVCTLALYPLTTILGRVPLRQLARALVPAQAAAVATRSSLATVPILLREATQLLHLPERVSAVVLPLGGAMLKLSRAASSPMKLVFLAWLLGVPLSVEQIIVFTLTIMLLSTSTPGVPRVITGSRSLPAYVSIGIAPEYVILLGASLVVTDVVDTVLNSTGYLSADVLVARLLGEKEVSPAETPVMPGVLAAGPAASPVSEPKSASP